MAHAPYRARTNERGYTMLLVFLPGDDVGFMPSHNADTDDLDIATLTGMTDTDVTLACAFVNAYATAHIRTNVHMMRQYLDRVTS